MTELDSPRSPRPVAPNAVRAPAAALALVLSFAAGATDAFAFLQLGGIFTANMTGNVILAGLTKRPDYPRTLVCATLAVVVFVAALLVGFRVTRRGRGGPQRMATVLTGSVLAQLGVAAGWLIAGTAHTLAAQAALVTLSTIAMALQTVIARRLETSSGVTTTFVTGSMTNLMQDLAEGSTAHARLRVSTVLMLAAGAVCGSSVIALSPLAGAALPALPTAAALVILVVTGRARAHRGAGLT